MIGSSSKNGCIGDYCSIKSGFAFKSKWWRQPAVIVFLVVTVALVFIPQFSASTHIAAFLVGIAVASAKRGWLKLTRDARRYF